LSEDQVTEALERARFRVAIGELPDAGREQLVDALLEQLSAERGQLPDELARAAVERDDRSATFGRLAQGRGLRGIQDIGLDESGGRQSARPAVPQLARCETDIVNGAETCVRVGACTRSRRGRPDSLCPGGAALAPAVCPDPAAASRREEPRGRRLSGWLGLGGREARGPRFCEAVRTMGL
jgi:hypothetical protein